MDNNRNFKSDPLVEYFDNEDIVIACIERGSAGMFKYSKSKKWEFITPGSIAYDSFHQNIYLTGHDFQRSSPGLINSLPSLPSIPDFKQVSWSDNFKPEKPLSSADFPKSKSYLEEQPGKKCRIWFILTEDLWETYSGDGEFLYYKSPVYLSQKEIEAYAAEKNKDPSVSITQNGTYHHIRNCHLELKDGYIDSPDFNAAAFEHYELERIVKDLEDLLAGRELK